ncbi:Arylsulfatase [Pontiella desulfatans]|uniref:Arylsulfatase n=1 Tax=Pontiella desulfatans TaxID=2750659 RepID=A0A6C2U782_PONDE|nr:sulfatase [Pontiella desulfatans]SPS73969.1 sulfatase S1_8 [Kiritimatiellales bacterium]VGO15391.1 Arylsulfatase [Pontiella desulfatans]
MNGKLLSIVMLIGMAVQAATERPNILFIIADDVSQESISAYGCSYIKTPNLDRLAKEGARFENAYANNPKCAPSRAMLVTGRYSWQLEEACNHWPHFPEKFKFYPHLLREAGYHVGYTGKGWSPGTYATADNPAGPEYKSKRLKPPYKGIANIDYAANLKVFLGELDGGHPFCFWLGTKEAHRGFEKDSWKKAGRKLEDAVVPPYWPDTPSVRGDLLDYANEVEWIDEQVGHALDVLEKKGLLENTLIVFTSDHGMAFPRVKGQIFEHGIHVPFIVWWKGVIQPGRVVEDFINFPDVAPTFLEVAGEAPHPQMTGKSFLDVLRSPKSGLVDPSRTYALVGKERHDTGRASEEGSDLGYPVRGIRTTDYLYVRNFKPDRWPVGNPEFGLRNCDGSPTKSVINKLQPDSENYRFYELNFGKRPEEMLYAVGKDPTCVESLAGNPEYAEPMKRLREKMETGLKAQQDPRMLGQGDLFDRYPYMGKPFVYPE